MLAVLLLLVVVVFAAAGDADACRRLHPAVRVVERLANCCAVLPAK